MSSAEATAPSSSSSTATTTSSTATSSTSTSSGGGWLDKVKSAANSAAEATKKAAAYAAESTKKTYEELKSTPTHIQCSGCPLQVEVPPNLFDWECENKHINDKNATVCATCKAPKPKLNDPSVVCGSCHSSTIVPSSNASKHLKQAATNTKKFINATAHATKEQVKYLSSAPETFHCAHCNSLLAVPTGPWACQTCTAENPEEATKCKQCGQKKSEQKAICGVCRQSTVIPTTNFVDGLKATSRDIAKSSSKVYMDVSGKHYVTCGRCGTHVPLDSTTTGAGTTAASGTAAGGTAGTAAPDGTAPTPAQQAAMKNMQCPSCKNPIES